MSNPACEAVQRAMEPLFEAEGRGQAPPELLAHLERCPECAQIFSLLGRLRSGDRHPEPSDADFLALRRGVLREVQRLQPPRPGLLESLAAWSMRPALALSGAVLVLALLPAAGFLAGRQTRTQALPAPSWASSEDALVRQIQMAALQNRAPQGGSEPAYQYGNVRMEARADGRMALSFDVSRHVALALPPNDPLVSDVLAQTLAGASPAGTKLQLIDCAGAALDPAVRDGLIQAMLTDANLGVRLKAQSKLVEQNGGPEIQAALLHVLQREESVQMKLVAIDHLTRQRINPTLLRQALAPAGRPDAVQLKAMTYLNEHGGNL